MSFSVANMRPRGWIGDQDFCGEDQAAVESGDQFLGDNRLQSEGELGSNLLLLIPRGLRLGPSAYRIFIDGL